MTAGKPVLYIASKDSELHSYADKYGNGQCFECDELETIALFIQRLSEDGQLQQQYKANSLKAAADFTRKNTSAIVEAYD